MKEFQTVITLRSILLEISEKILRFHKFFYFLLSIFRQAIIFYYSILTDLYRVSALINKTTNLKRHQIDPLRMYYYLVHIITLLKPQVAIVSIWEQMLINSY